MVVFSRQCPRCKGETLNRRRRNWWMRIVPRSKRYRCERCSCGFVFVDWRLGKP